MVLRIPRHACSPRDRARAGDLWRIVQEVAIRASADAGWPPARYREAGTGFVVRELVGVHRREASYDEELVARTWITAARRSLILQRYVGIAGVLDTSVQWVHIAADGGLLPAPPELMAAFAVHGGAPAVQLPAVDEPDPSPVPTLALVPWWTEMDPLGHTNHPRYVDWADEALSVALAARGHDPIGLVPVAERMRFTSAARAGDDVRVDLRRDGWAGEAAVYAVRITRVAADPARLAPHEHRVALCEGVVVRRHVSGRAALP